MKPTAAATIAITTTAPAMKITLYSIDTRDTSIDAYYQDDYVSYAEVAVYINGVVPKGSYCFSVALDDMPILWKCATHKQQEAPESDYGQPVLLKQQPRHRL